MFNNSRKLEGFRFSAADAFILLAGALAAWWLYLSEMPLWWLVPVVAGHFFLFCNVFRVRRKYELFWAAAFVGNTVFWLWGRLSTHWLPPLLTQTPVTLLVIAAEMLSPRYHGIFAARINRRLMEYMQTRNRSLLI